MTIEDIRFICKSMKGVTEDIKWENHLCFNVGGKMFLITSPDEFPVSASIKVSDEAFMKLPDTEGIIPAPYLARHRWIKLDDINIWSRKQWEFYTGHAYQMVLDKLPAKKRKEVLNSDQASVATVKSGKKSVRKK